MILKSYLHSPTPKEPLNLARNAENLEEMILHEGGCVVYTIFINNYI